MKMKMSFEVKDENENKNQREQNAGEAVVVGLLWVSWTLPGWCLCAWCLRPHRGSDRDVPSAARSTRPSPD